MTQSIESILASPDKKKETEYNIITTMSTWVHKDIKSVENIITWWWNKNKKWTKKALLNGNQITTTGEDREKLWLDRRLYNN